MIAKIIVGIILFLISMLGVIISLYENTVNGESKEKRYIHGMYICYCSVICGILITWFAFCL